MSAAALREFVTLPHLNEVSFGYPAALYLLLAVAALTAWALLQADSPRKLFAPLLRAAVLALLVLAFAGPQITAHHEGNASAVAVDVSDSMTPAMRHAEASLIRDGLNLRSGDPAIVFGDNAVPTTVGEAIKILDDGAGCDACRSGGTNLEAALRKLADSTHGEGGPLVLITDGWENRGDSARAISPMLAAGAQLSVLTPPNSEAVPNVAVTEMQLPRALASSEPFQLGVTMLNMNASTAPGTIKLYENLKLIDQREVTLNPGRQRFDFPVRTEETGLISYRALFVPLHDQQDTYKEDDSAESWVGIGARRKILLLSGSARDSNYLTPVIKKMGFDSELVDLSQRKFDGRLAGFESVVLNNVSRAQLGPAGESTLVKYAEGGGTVAMIGGDQSLGLGGFNGSQLETAMPVVMKPPEHKQQRRALVLIIDKSLSMGRENKLVYAKAAARMATKALNDDDLLSVIGFDAQPFVVVPLQTVKESKPYLNDMIDRLKARGTTFLLPALKEAERDLVGSGAGIKHVVVLTDGETGGTAAMYYDLVSTMHHEGGVTISTIAIGHEPNLRLLNAISQYGGGAFYHTFSAETLPELFMQDVRQHGGDQTVVEKQFLPLSAPSDPVLKELAGRKLPPIKGFIGTELKPRAALDMYVEHGDKREPLIATWKFGSGRTMVVTTDASGRWSSEWLRGDVFAEIWNKLLSWLTPQSAALPQFDVALGYREGRLNLKLTDYSDDVRRATQMLHASAQRPDGTSEQLVMSEDAPGELSASFNAPTPGIYRIQLKSSHGDKTLTFPPLAYTVSAAINAEVPRPAPNYDLLEHLTAATGGRLNPDLKSFALSRPTIERRTSLMPQLLIAAMLLLIGEAVVRRVTY